MERTKVRGMCKETDLIVMRESRAFLSCSNTLRQIEWLWSRGTTIQDVDIPRTIVFMMADGPN